MQDTTKLTAGQFLKTMTLIHSGFMGVMMVFAVVVLYLGDGWTWEVNKDDAMFYLIIVPIAAIVLPILGNLLFNKRLDIISRMDSIKSKLTSYLPATLVRYAFMEAPVLLSLVSGMLTGSMFFIGIAALLMVYFFLQRPSKNKIIQHLGPSMELQRQFRNQGHDL